MPIASAQLTNDRRITLEQLRTLVSIVEVGGFQGASYQMHRTQSAVTQNLKKLEEILGCRLLERKQGHVAGLTPEGERFFSAAREILVRVSDAQAYVQKPELSGRISLGVPDDFRIGDLHRAISRCLEMNSRLRIQVTSALSAELSKLIRRGDLDMAILMETESAELAGPEYNRKSLVDELLRAEPLLWVYNRPVAFNDLSELPLVAFPDGCAYRRAALATLEKRAKSSFFAYTSASYENVRSAISAGLGIGILPACATTPDHFILTASDGFPKLPKVRVMLRHRSRGSLLIQVAEVLRRVVTQNSAR